MEGNYLITTDNWFLAPNGKSYKGVWGNVQIVDDLILKIKTNRMATNWFAMVGSHENHVLIAGCQIHYAVKTDSEPNTDPVNEYTTNDTGCVEFVRPTQIYIAK